MALIILACILCSMFSSGWGFFKSREKFTCDYYTGIGKKGCLTKEYCSACDNRNREQCSLCRNCVYLDSGKCVPGDFYGPYNQSIKYSTYEYDIPYDFDTPERRQTDLRYNYQYKII